MSLFEKINAIQKFFNDEANSELIDRGIRAGIVNEAASVADAYNKISKENSELKLGIVGRVKAGKSSFLNALLFDGRDVLPKAATPMTAALTKITYAYKNEARVFFYSPGEWRQIENLARECEKVFEEEYQKELEAQNSVRASVRRGFDSVRNTISQDSVTPPREVSKKKEITREAVRQKVLSDPSKLSEQLKASLELFEMARRNEVKNGISIRNFLGREKLISGDPTQNSAEFMRALQDYVGADGLYTPIVSYIELSVNDESLKDFVVVDTPGLNDPITSRSERTNKFLKECHAVLLLSSVTQFLNESDIDLITQKFQDAAISKGYIIGTMMDIGVREYDRKSGYFQDDYLDSKDNYVERAENVFASLTQNIRIKRTPEFVSSFLFSIARKRETGRPLNSDEEFLIAQCKKLFPHDAEEIFGDIQNCYEASGFNAVHTNIIAPIREQRNTIIEQKTREFEAAQCALFLRKLEEAMIDAENRLAQIKNNDEDSLKARYDACETCLKNSRYDVQNIFDEISINAERTINRLKIDIHNLMSEHRHLNITVDVDTRVVSEGIIFKDYHTETTRTRRASAAQASGNIDAFAGEAERLVENELVNLIDVDTIIARIKRTIEGAFEVMGQNSGSEITGPLNAVLSGLTIRRIDFTKSREAKKAIYDKFSTDVTDSDIARLERVQDEQLHEVLTTIEAELDLVNSNIRNMMNEKAGTFIDDVRKSLDSSMKEIEHQLNERDKYIQRYQTFIAGINKLKEELR